MVAIRSMGLGMESIVGYLDEDDDAVCFVPDSTLLGLITISTERFQENDSRRARFCNGMLNGLSASQGEPMTKQGKDGAVWEDAQARKERMRREGLERSKALKEKLQQNNTTNV
jgi:tRNA wybutosine-synthesizing protein 3